MKSHCLCYSTDNGFSSTDSFLPQPGSTDKSRGVQNRAQHPVGHHGDPDADSALTKEECDEYVALLKEVAAKYELPVLDLYENSGLEPNDADARARYYTENGKTENSGVHPSSEGHKLMYPQWRDFVTELLSRA